MSEEDIFTEALVDRLSLNLTSAHVARKMSLLYDLSVDERGAVQMGVDIDTGEPIRGKGKGFEQDMLIYEKVNEAHTSIVPRIVVEVKYNHVTTHDVIVYSEKANRIRRIYPYVRYGLLLGKFKTVPGRVLRLGQEFDFICTLQHPFVDAQIQDLRQLLRDEVEVSISLGKLLTGNIKTSMVHRKLLLKGS